jgi:hypothetical protein
MRVKNLLKIIFISMLLGGIVLGGVYAFFKIKSDEEMYRADLFALVPADCDLLFYSRRPGELPDRLPVMLLPDKSCFLLAKSLYAASGSGVNIPGNSEILFSFKESDGLIFCRATPKDIRTWENERIERREFLFSPQKETRRNVSISVYLTAEDRFFCFTHYRGLFIGSFSKRMLYHALEMCDAQETLRDNGSFITAQRMSGEKAPASCFFKRNNWFFFDISFSNGNYLCSGCLLPAYTSAGLYRSLNLPAARHEIDPEVLPETVSELIYTNTDYGQMAVDGVSRKDSLLLRHATGDVSLVCYADTSRRLHETICVELKSREAFLSELSSVVSQSGESGAYLKVMDDDDIRSRRREKTYRLSPDIRLTSCLDDMYRQEEPDIFTFYGQYLLLARSGESLEVYLDFIRSGRTFDRNPLYRLYSDNKSADAGISFLLDSDQLPAHPESGREILPECFLRNDNSRKFRAFAQFSREEELVYYSVILSASDTVEEGGE